MPLSSGRRAGCRADTPAGAAFAMTILLGAAVVTGLPTPTPAADADTGDPGAGRLARSQRDVRERAATLGRIEGRLARANADLERVATQAEVAVERYNGEIVRLRQARTARETTRVRLAAAMRGYETVRAELAAFAAGAYRASVAYGGWAPLLGADGGPQAFMDRADLVQVMARRQAGLMDQVQAAKIISAMYGHRAATAVVAQRAAARRAAAAKRRVQAAVARQRAVVRTLRVKRKRLVARLTRAKARTDALRRAHAAAAGGGVHGIRLAGAGPGGVAAAAALKWLGTPYSWGGGTAGGPSYGILQGAGIKGFDCSGLALYAWAHAGVRLDHWAGMQWTSGPHVPTTRLRPGDLVFFATDTNDPGTIHHVGIYVGGGRMAEAPYTGARVRVSSIWRGDLIGATRPD
jgi:cell wall-associated NlpC family hydrolase